MSQRRPFPPGDLRERSLPITRIAPGASWARIHSLGTRPLWFGPASGNPPSSRFDDPRGEYRVCYIGTTKEAAFAEVFLRNVPVRLLSRSELEARALTALVVVQAIRLVTFRGRGLSRLGATAEVATGGDYELSQGWGRGLWEHRDRPDGILYRTRHLDKLSLALFDRAADSVEPRDRIAFRTRPDLAGELLKYYGIGLTD